MSRPRCEVRGFGTQAWTSAWLAVALVVSMAANRLALADFVPTSIGRADARGFDTPVNQRVTPAGLQVQLPDMRPQALALSPDGELLITAGLTHE